MSEIHFIVEEVPEGGYVARAAGVDIFTEADDLPRLRAQIRDAVRCHFDEDEMPALIRLHITREEILAVWTTGIHESHASPGTPSGAV